jgi:hypothetical protein
MLRIAGCPNRRSPTDSGNTHAVLRIADCASSRRSPADSTRVCTSAAAAPKSEDIWRNSLLRYVGYSNEVGESFRYVAPRLVVPRSVAQNNMVFICFMSIAMHAHTHHSRYTHHSR